MYYGIIFGVADLSQTGVAGAESVADGQSWTQVVFAILAAIITAFVLPWLKQQASAKRAETAKLLAEANEKKLTARKRLWLIAQDYLYEIAANTFEKNLPDMALDIKENGWDTKKIKQRLHEWGKDAKAKTIAYFKLQGIDIIAELGDDALDDLIRKAADSTSPFPGKETAAALLEDHVTDWIIDHGVNYARNKWCKAHND